MPDPVDTRVPARLKLLIVGLTFALVCLSVYDAAWLAAASYGALFLTTLYTVQVYEPRMRAGQVRPRDRVIVKLLTLLFVVGASVQGFLMLRELLQYPPG
jgi:hypothetical protein